MPKIALLLLLCLYSLDIVSQVKVRKLTQSELPSGIKYEGKICSIITWNDGLGENIVLTSEMGIYTSKKFAHDNGGSDAELFAYHYLKHKSEFLLNWKVYDFISDCPVDIEANFMKNTLQVTDLNNNGQGEIWVMYRKICHGDVSSSELKIIMYEAKRKFAMRGFTKIYVGVDDQKEKMYSGGDYKFDSAFNKGPKEFREFAIKLWQQNMDKKLEDNE